MTQRLRHTLAAAVLLSAGPALACSPALNDAARSEVLEDCAVRHTHVPIGSEGLMAAENLWLGYVGQLFYEGDGCYVREAQVVVDCADGTAFMFGPEGALTVEDHRAAMDGLYGDLMRSIRQMPWGYGEVRDMDGDEGIRVADLGTTLDGAVALGGQGQAYDLTCACRLFNPDSVGAGR